MPSREPGIEPRGALCPGRGFCHHAYAGERIGCRFGTSQVSVTRLTAAIELNQSSCDRLRRICGTPPASAGVLRAIGTTVAHSARAKKALHRAVAMTAGPKRPNCAISEPRHLLPKAIPTSEHGLAWMWTTTNIRRRNPLATHVVSGQSWTPTDAEFSGAPVTLAIGVPFAALTRNERIWVAERPTAATKSPRVRPRDACAARAQAVGCLADGLAGIAAVHQAEGGDRRAQRHRGGVGEDCMRDRRPR